MAEPKLEHLTRADVEAIVLEAVRGHLPEFLRTVAECAHRGWQQSEDEAGHDLATLKHTLQERATALEHEARGTRRLPVLDATPPELPFPKRECVVLLVLGLYGPCSLQDAARFCEFTGGPERLLQARNVLDELRRRNLVVDRDGRWDLHDVIRSVLTLGRMVARRGLEGFRHG